MSWPHMPDAVTAEVLNELHASVRQFFTAKGALLWYRDQLLQRLRVSRDLASATGGDGRRNDATFAAIAACLALHHEADEDGDGLAYVPIGRWQKQPIWSAGEALLWLVAWYENTSDDGSGMAVDAGLEEQRPTRDHDGAFLARKAGVERRNFNRRCKSVARKLRLRLVHAGLVVQREN